MCRRPWISPWIPADPHGLPPETYPSWRRIEIARREEEQRVDQAGEKESDPPRR